MGRKVYDLDERERIENLLDEQREIFREEEKKSNSPQILLTKFGVIATGVTIFFFGLKFIKKRFKK